MSLKFALPLAFATACLSLAGAVHGATYTETGDAGDLPAAAQLVSGPAGTPLTLLSGNITLTNGTSDSDMFLIYVSDPSSFSASTNTFFPGSNNFDTQIFLFSASGFGIVGNDDAASGGSLSSIPANSFAGPVGAYYLLISGSGRYAISSGGLIFPNYTDNTTNPTTTVGPTGPGGTGAITGYTGSSNDGGAYRITLTGAQFVPTVPEPSIAAFAAAGLAGLAFMLRRRRRAV